MDLEKVGRRLKINMPVYSVIELLRFKKLKKKRKNKKVKKKVKTKRMINSKLILSQRKLFLWLSMTKQCLLLLKG